MLRFLFALGYRLISIYFLPTTCFLKLDRVAPLIADTPRANSTTENDTHPLSDIKGEEAKTKPPDCLTCSKYKMLRARKL